MAERGKMFAGLEDPICIIDQFSYVETQFVGVAEDIDAVVRVGSVSEEEMSC